MSEPERVCGKCIHLIIRSGGELWTSEYLPVCRAPLPMWTDDGDHQVMDENADATHCQAYKEREIDPGGKSCGTCTRYRRHKAHPETGRCSFYRTATACSDGTKCDQYRRRRDA